MLVLTGLLGLLITGRVSPSGGIMGAAVVLLLRSLADIGFRTRHAAAVLSIHRDGRPVEGKPGTAKLRAGDALLVFSDAEFTTRWRDRGDFALLAPLRANGRRDDGRRGPRR